MYKSRHRYYTICISTKVNTVRTNTTPHSYNPTPPLIGYEVVMDIFRWWCIWATLLTFCITTDLVLYILHRIVQRNLVKIVIYIVILQEMIFFFFCIFIRALLAVSVVVFGFVSRSKVKLTTLSQCYRTLNYATLSDTRRWIENYECLHQLLYFVRFRPFELSPRPKKTWLSLLLLTGIAIATRLIRCQSRRCISTGYAEKVLLLSGFLIYWNS